MGGKKKVSANIFSARLPWFRISTMDGFISVVLE
jgi:hypothetical protein